MKLKENYIILTLLGVEIPCMLAKSIYSLMFLSVFMMIMFTVMYIILRGIEWHSTDGKGITPLIPLYLLMFVQPLIGILVKFS